MSERALPHSSVKLAVETEPETSTITLLTNQFGALLDAVKELNATAGAQKTTMEDIKVTMNGVRGTLLEHGTKFDILTRDALKGESIPELIGGY